MWLVVYSGYVIGLIIGFSAADLISWSRPNICPGRHTQAMLDRFLAELEPYMENVFDTTVLSAGFVTNALSLAAGLAYYTVGAGTEIWCAVAFG